mgnify:CR=1 FL=1
MKNYRNRLITIKETRDIKSLEKNISYLEDEIENTEEGIRRGRVALTAIRSAPDIQDNINFSLFLDELETRLEAIELNPLGRNPRDPLDQHGENYILFTNALQQVEFNLPLLNREGRRIFENDYKHVFFQILELITANKISKIQLNNAMRMYNTINKRQGKRSVKAFTISKPRPYKAKWSRKILDTFGYDMKRGRASPSPPKTDKRYLNPDIKKNIGSFLLETPYPLNKFIAHGKKSKKAKKSKKTKKSRKCRCKFKKCKCNTKK